MKLTLLLTGGTLALQIILSLLGAALLRSREGSLDWIRFYDRKPLALPGSRCRLQKWDGLCWPLTVVLAAALQALQAVLLLLPVLPQGAQGLGLLIRCGAAGLRAGGLYLLLALSFGHPALSLLGTLPVGLCCDETAPLCWALALFYLWFCAPSPGRFLPRALSLGGAALLFTAGLLLPGALWLLPFGTVLFLVALVQRFRAHDGHTVRAVVLTLLWAAVCVALGYAALTYLHTQALPAPAAWRGLPGALWTLLRDSWKPAALLHPWLLPQLLLTVFGLGWAVACYRLARTGAALMSALSAAAQLAMLALGGGYFLPLGLLGWACLSAQLCTRGRGRWAAALMAVNTLATLIVTAGPYYII